MPNKVYAAPETPITFKSSGGTVLFTPTSVANGAGRISDRWDRGTGSKPMRYKWRVKTKAAAALAVGMQLEIYFITWHTDATGSDGNFGASDAAWSAADKKRNLQAVGVVEADSTSNGEIQSASGVVWIFDRYVSLAWWNALGQALSSTAGDHEFILTPYPDEIQ